MGGIAFEELILIMVVAVIVYGKELPSVARKLAKAYNKLRRYMSDVQDEIRRAIPPEELDVDTRLPEPDDYSPPQDEAPAAATASDGNGPFEPGRGDPPSPNGSTAVSDGDAADEKPAEPGGITSDEPPKQQDSPAGTAPAAGDPEPAA